MDEAPKLANHRRDQHQTKHHRHKHRHHHHHHHEREQPHDSPVAFHVEICVRYGIQSGEKKGFLRHFVAAWAVSSFLFLVINFPCEKAWAPRSAGQEPPTPLEAAVRPRAIPVGGRESTEPLSAASPPRLGSDAVGYFRRS